MKGKATYNLFDCFIVLKGVIAFCLLLFILAKPVVNVIFHTAEIEYELSESYEETDSEEKEDTTDSEEEDQKHYYSNSDLEFHSNHNPSLFTLHKNLISSHVDISFPPPDRS